MGFALRVVDVARDLREERGVSPEDLVERAGGSGVLEEVGVEELQARAGLDVRAGALQVVQKLADLPGEREARGESSDGPVAALMSADSTRSTSGGTAPPTAWSMVTSRSIAPQGRRRSMSVRATRGRAPGSTKIVLTRCQNASCTSGCRPLTIVTSASFGRVTASRSPTCWGTDSTPGQRWSCRTSQSSPSASMRPPA